MACYIDTEKNKEETGMPLTDKQKDNLNKEDS